MNGVHLRVTMFLLFCAVALSAQTPCTVTLPITVVAQDGTIVKDLPPEALTTAMKEISLQPDFKADDSKRRILIVLDGSPYLAKVSLATEKWIARSDRREGTAGRQLRIDLRQRRTRSHSVWL